MFLRPYMYFPCPQYLYKIGYRIPTKFINIYSKGRGHGRWNVSKWCGEKNMNNNEGRGKFILEEI